MTALSSALVGADGALILSSNFADGAAPICIAASSAAAVAHRTFRIDARERDASLVAELILQSSAMERTSLAWSAERLGHRSSLGRAIAAARALSEGGGVHPAPTRTVNVLPHGECLAGLQKQLSFYGASFPRFGKPLQRAGTPAGQFVPPTVSASTLSVG